MSGYMIKGLEGLTITSAWRIIFIAFVVNCKIRTQVLGETKINILQKLDDITNTVLILLNRKNEAIKRQKNYEYCLKRQIRHQIILLKLLNSVVHGGQRLRVSQQFGLQMALTGNGIELSADFMLFWNRQKSRDFEFVQNQLSHCLFGARGKKQLEPDYWSEMGNKFTHELIMDYYKQFLKNRTKWPLKRMLDNINDAQSNQEISREKGKVEADTTLKIVELLKKEQLKVRTFEPLTNQIKSQNPLQKMRISSSQQFYQLRFLEAQEKNREVEDELRSSEKGMKLCKILVSWRQQENQKMKQFICQKISYLESELRDLLTQNGKLKQQLLQKDRQIQMKNKFIQKLKRVCTQSTLIKTCCDLDQTLDENDDHLGCSKISIKNSENQKYIVNRGVKDFSCIQGLLPQFQEGSDFQKLKNDNSNVRKNKFQMNLCELSSLIQGCSQYKSSQSFEKCFRLLMKRIQKGYCELEKQMKVCRVRQQENLQKAKEKELQACLMASNLANRSTERQQFNKKFQALEKLNKYLTEKIESDQKQFGQMITSLSNQCYEHRTQNQHLTHSLNSIKRLVRQKDLEIIKLCELNQNLRTQLTIKQTIQPKADKTRREFEAWLTEKYGKANEKLRLDLEKYKDQVRLLEDRANRQARNL